MRFSTIIATAVVVVLPIGARSAPLVTKGDVNGSLVLDFVVSALNGSNITPASIQKRASSSPNAHALQLLDARMSIGVTLGLGTTEFKQIRDRAEATNNTQVVALAHLGIASIGVANVGFNDVLSSLMSDETVDVSNPDLNVIAAVGVGLGVITQNMKVVIANADAQLSALISQATGDLGNLINQVKSLEGNSTST